jgi:dihydrofolate reductase
MTATKYVASNTISSHAWQPSVFLGGHVAEKVADLKRQQGPDLHVYGSANLVQTLMKHDLVDASLENGLSPGQAAGAGVRVTV